MSGLSECWLQQFHFLMNWPVDLARAHMAGGRRRRGGSPQAASLDSAASTNELVLDRLPGAHAASKTPQRLQLVWCMLPPALTSIPLT